MATLTLKNIPETLLEQLRKRAAGERRSLNQEVIHLLEETMASGRPSDRIQEAVARQVAAWRQIAGKWRSKETAAQEIRRIYSARSKGRDVEL